MELKKRLVGGGRCSVNYKVFVVEFITDVIYRYYYLFFIFCSAMVGDRL